MSIQRLSPKDFTTLENDGFRSEQIVWPRNAPDALITVTRVTMQPKAVSKPHVHPDSEQTWMVERGTATLLMAAGRTEKLATGDVVRTPAGEMHGIENTGSEPFVYLAITTPPVDFSPAYARSESGRPAG